MRISDWSSDVCSSDLFRTEAAMQERTQGKPFVANIETATGSKQRHGITEVYDVVLVDHAISIHVLVSGIARIHLFGSIAYHHGFAFEVVYQVASYRPCIALFLVLVHAEVTITLERPK